MIAGLRRIIGLKLHPRQDFTLDIDSGRDLDELEAVLGQLEYATFRDIENRLAALHGVVAGEGPMLDLADELRLVAVFDDTQATVLDRQLKPACRERADEHHFLGVLADVDKAAGAGEPRTEFADVQIALLVRLGEAEEGRIKAAAIIEVELIRLIDDGLRIDRGSEIESASRNAADDALARPSASSGR